MRRKRVEGCGILPPSRAARGTPGETGEANEPEPRGLVMGAGSDEDSCIAPPDPGRS